MQLQRVCRDTLPWLISFSLDVVRAHRFRYTTPHVESHSRSGRWHSVWRARCGPDAADVLSGQDDSLARCICESLRHWIRHRMCAATFLARLVGRVAVRTTHQPSGRYYHAQVYPDSRSGGPWRSRDWRFDPWVESEHLTMRWSERRTAVRSTSEMTSTLSLRAARASRPPSLILFSLGGPSHLFRTLCVAS